MSIYNPKTSNPDAWASLVEKQSKGLTPDEFTWLTPEDIPLKMLYTAEDTEALPYINTMPGMSPYIRSPQATMYAGRPWTIRPICGLLHCGGIQRVLSRGAGSRRAGDFGCI